jgi:dTDP-4-amino-4,6-dideoxygalactose transaminase
VTTLAPSVPFLDLTSMTDRIRLEIDAAIGGVIDHGMFVGGPEVTAFEEEFAAFCGARHAVGVGNGTDALMLALVGLGIGSGDEVIVPTNTFVATAEGVVAAGARPVFVDVDPDTLLLDPAAAAAAITPATAAVVAVHLFGQPADVRLIARIARRHGLALVEDAAQAHGAADHGRRVGTFGDAATFSFYPGKSLGALGDGGAVVTDDAALADRVRALADHGRSPWDRSRHDVPGCNSRLDTIQAAVLRVKLRRLAVDNARRVALMGRYRELLGAAVRPIGVRAGATPVYHLAVVEVDDRAAVCKALTQHQIGWGVHYPVPCHRQPAFATGERLPVAERAASRILSLPMSPTMSWSDVALVCDVVRGAVSC